MNADELSLILASHRKWLRGEKDGQRANLAHAELRYANLPDAELRYANLSGANLSDAYLTRADLRDADLRYANLSGAYLPDADLRYANLSGANLSGANLVDANLSSAKGIWVGPNVDGFTFVAFLRGGEVMILAGCRCFSIDGAREWWGADHRIEWDHYDNPQKHRDQCRAAVEYLVTITSLS